MKGIKKSKIIRILMEEYYEETGNEYLPGNEDLVKSLDNTYLLLDDLYKRGIITAENVDDFERSLGLVENNAIDFIDTLDCVKIEIK